MGITDKGKYTVKECKLNRTNRTIARAKMLFRIMQMALSVFSY